MSKIYRINPKGLMSQLSHAEVALLGNKVNNKNIYQLFRNCALAVLSSGIESDDAEELWQQHENFNINIIPTNRGICLELINPPEQAFVDGKLITNIQYNLLAVLRDILFVHSTLFNLDNKISSDDITNLIFYIVRNTNLFQQHNLVDLVACWGGHSISSSEYSYCRQLGSQLGLRELNIITGCGAGAMEAPMKGAAVGHANQRYRKSLFIGITEPSIISAEPPNPIVNELIVMPDIEKRLESFVRLAHAIVIFPGGVGTFEELLYILAIKLAAQNQNNPLPVILTGDESAQIYFDAINQFIIDICGEEVTKLYDIIIDDAVTTGQQISLAVNKVKQYRQKTDAYYSFNWELYIDPRLQQNFIPTHENMTKLNLDPNQAKDSLLINLRSLFSGLVAGNIKPTYIKLIQQHGPYQIKGDQYILQRVEELLTMFIQQNRMKLPGKQYNPCFQIIK